MTVLCECGCGLPAPLAVETRADRGWTKGEPVRFIVGHNNNVRHRVDWQDPFLDALRATGSVNAALAATGVAVRVAYDERNRNPEFAKAWKATPRKMPRRSDEELLDELRAWWHLKGEVPTCAAFGRGRANVVSRRFGSWRRALALAGLPDRASATRGVRLGRNRQMVTAGGGVNQIHPGQPLVETIARERIAGSGR